MIEMIKASDSRAEWMRHIGSHLLAGGITRHHVDRRAANHTVREMWHEDENHMRYGSWWTVPPQRTNVHHAHDKKEDREAAIDITEHSGGWPFAVPPTFGRVGRKS